MAQKKFTASYASLRPDGRYNSKLAAKFINCLMYSGKRSVAQRIFYDAMDRVAEKIRDASPWGNSASSCSASGSSKLATRIAARRSRSGRS